MTLQNQSTVLFVDDEPFVLDALKRVLQEEDYQLLFAGSAREAIELMERTPAHLVVSDYRMPSMNGGELLRIMSERWPDTVRIILSGFADLTSVISAINDGQIFKFVAKPWRNEDLKEVVRTGVEKYWQQIELHSLAETALAQNTALLSLHLDSLTNSTERYRELQEQVEALKAYRLAFLTMKTPALLFRGPRCIEANDAARASLAENGGNAVSLKDHPVVQDLSRRVAEAVSRKARGLSRAIISLESGRTLAVELVIDSEEVPSEYAVARLQCEP